MPSWAGASARCPSPGRSRTCCGVRSSRSPAPSPTPRARPGSRSSAAWSMSRGVWLMSAADSELVYGIGSGVLVGIGLACSGMSVVLSAVMRASPPEKRGLYGGIVTAGGSVGQLIFMPATQAMIETLHWQPTLQILTVVSIAIVLCAFALPRGPKQAAAGDRRRRRHHHRRGAARRVRGPLLPAAGDGLLRLRLPPRLHRIPPAAIRRAVRAAAQGRVEFAGAGRRLQCGRLHR